MDLQQASTRSSSNLVGESSPNPTSLNPKRRNRRRSKQPFILEESPVDTMVDERTMAELLCAPTEGYAEATVVPPILAEHFELKHSLINMMISDQFFGLVKDNPRDHIRAACRWLEKEPPRFILTWEDLAWDCYKDLLHACPHHGFTKLRQLDTFYNALNPADQDSLSFAAGGNLLERRTQDVLMIIENNSKIAKLTHAVNQQTSDVTTAMTAVLKQFQATPPPASVKAVEEICVTCGGAHPYYQCLAADGNTFPEFQDNIQGCVSAAAVNYNQGNSGYRPSSVPSPPRSVLVIDGPFIPMPPQFINPEEDERVEETLTDPKLPEYTIKDPLHPNIPYPSRMYKEKQQDKDEIQIHKFWQMFKQLHINITLVDALILILKYQKMLKSLLSNKEKLLELANTPLDENFLAVILKKLPEKLGDPGKFLIPCGFSELKCKALADLGASINLIPLSVWKNLGLPKLISTRMTLELANRAICTPVGIARDVFVLVGKFTFPADFVIVDYKSDPRINHGEEMILRDGDERLTLNIRHGTSSYSNQPHKESINMINIYNDSCEDYLEDLFVINHLSGNPTFSSHTDLTPPEVINPLSGNPTSSSPDHLLEEFVDELALITFLSKNNDLPFDIESDLIEIEYLLNHDPTKEMDSIFEDSVDECNLADPNNDLFDTIPEMFTNEHTLDYSSPPLYDDEDKIKESKLLIDEIDPPRSSDFLPSPEYDSVLYEDFSKVDVLPSTDNEDKVFNPGILIHENLSEVIVQVTPDKNVMKISISNTSLILEDFDPPLYELPFHKEVLWSETLLSFSSKNEEKVFNPGILTSKGVHTSFLSELSHRDPKAFKVIKNFESPVEIFPCSYGEDIRILDVPVQVTPDKNVKKISISNASSILEDFNPPLYELPFHKEVLESESLLSFSSENEKKFSNPGFSLQNEFILLFS
nr:reverse transcriptase domain-containing protein [Tanacetum cinerariifolium]